MRFFSVAVFGLLYGVTAQALSLGTIGPAYEIAETDALAHIQALLQKKQKSGELQRWQNEAIKRSLQHIGSPKPVPHLTTVVKRAVRVLDPTVSYPRSIKTDEGKVIVPAGMRLNPLERMTLSKRYVFFDGRDPQQRKAVKRLVQREGHKVKPILVGGSWLTLTRAWKTQVYFDQQGTLSRRFGLRAVPSVIRQQGTQLLLEEVPAKELNPLTITKGM